MNQYASVIVTIVLYFLLTKFIYMQGNQVILIYVTKGYPRSKVLVNDTESQFQKGFYCLHGLGRLMDPLLFFGNFRHCSQMSLICQCLHLQCLVFFFHRCARFYVTVFNFFQQRFISATTYADALCFIWIYLEAICDYQFAKKDFMVDTIKILGQIARLKQIYLAVVYIPINFICDL